MTNLKQILEQPKRVRVIDSTYCPNKNTKALTGKELEVRVIYYFDKTVSLWTEDQSDFWTFNFTDIAELTPLKLNDRYIAIGDVLVKDEDEYEVYGYRYFDGEYYLSIAQNYDYKNSCTSWTQRQLEYYGFTLKSSPKESEEEIQKAIKLLTKVGKIKQGMIIE